MPDHSAILDVLTAVEEQRDTYLEQLKQCQAELSKTKTERDALIEQFKKAFAGLDWRDLLSPCAGDQPVERTLADIRADRIIREMARMHGVSEKALSDAVAQMGDQRVGRAHHHYFIDVSRYKLIDIYRLIELLGITDPVAQHVFKKAAATGKRGHKDTRRDWQDIRDSAARRLEMMDEDNE